MPVLCLWGPHFKEQDSTRAVCPQESCEWDPGCSDIGHPFSMYLLLSVGQDQKAGHPLKLVRKAGSQHHPRPTESNLYFNKIFKGHLDGSVS